MSTRPFRFGVSMTSTGSHEAWQAKARQAEELGYDVLHIPDHLGASAPFPALVSAADATTTLRVGTLVLNSGFYRPALLARDIADTDQLTDGRLEVGLGAGCVGAEFHAAELAYPSSEERVDNLAHTVAELHRMFATPEQRPAVRQRPGPPLLLAGLSDRILRLAAREADIIGFPVMTHRTPPGLDPQQVLADRVDHVRAEAGARFGRLELNLFVSSVVLGDANSASESLDLTAVHRTAPNLTREQILRLPNVLAGTVEQIAETLDRYRDTYRLTYFSVLEPHMTDFAKVIDRLR
ncbi:TIGR03621 family F420-dependent LLM class oxidoreductase [Streptomyces sp. NBC_01716]|uniref:TIGR03621 family F420-dependent LLM class oxidoreductase n=1 Tax=Streptomyces sp. NBC_01716 TaxID=2975917 RepID=UPI002E33E8E9|nr:TIGR03621 family F420-dependent LLM class oxidoreductase [Streptomyces sp. NBC_01716]